MKSLMIPESLDVDELKASFPPCKGFHKDKVYYICDAIYTASNRLDYTMKHALKSSPYFVPLSSKILEHYLGTEYYKGIIEWMITAGIIQCDRHYEKNVISKGYRYSKDYRDSRAIEVQVSDLVMSRKSLYVPVKTKKVEVEETATVQKIQQWFGGLQISKEPAVEQVNRYYLEDLQYAEMFKGKVRSDLLFSAETRKVHSLKAINAIADGSYKKPSQDPTGRRLHSPITMLPKHLRGYVTLYGKQVAQADISNSQFYFTNYILQEQNWTIKEDIVDDIWKDLKLPNQSINSTTLSSFFSSMFSEFEYCTHSINTNNLFAELTTNGSFYTYLACALDNHGSFFYGEDNIAEKRAIVKDVFIRQINAEESTGYNFNMISPERKASEVKRISKKEKAHKWLYGGRNAILWKVFKEEFPTVFHCFEKIKSPAYTNLSALLQRTESIGVIEQGCGLITKEFPDMPILPFHDAVVSTVEGIEDANRCLKQALGQFVGLEPSTDVKKWEVEHGDIEPLWEWSPL